ncbi:asparagine--tRNA ligase, partial [candidate division WWE3 bacterium]|nr:asparagine--tRNA ligase [candidate division WWE3 bacterium]
MNEYTAIENLTQMVNQDVHLRGWMFNKRSSGKIHFLHVRDGSGSVQVVVDEGTVDQKTIETVKDLTIESSLLVSGTVSEDKRSPLGVEIHASTITPVQIVTEDYPIGKKEHGVDFLLSNRHLWLRSPTQWATMRIRNHAFLALTKFFESEGYVRFDSPILTPNACEGTTDLFEIDYFGKPAYLSQSGQLYLEAAIASLGKVYDFGPVFRAEKSKTRRHLNEFWMLDAECAFMDLDIMMDFEERLVMSVVSYMLEHARPEFKILGRDISKFENIKTPFLRLHYDEAVEKLRGLGSDINWGEDFGNDDEDTLFKDGDQPIFVHRYPTEIKGFYFKTDEVRPELSLSLDLFVPEGYGELIGGGQRVDSFDTLINNIHEESLSEEDFAWYLDLRKFGSVPHSGFGIGFERLVAWL